MELQELVARARLLFSGAPKRFIVFNLVNSKRSAKDIAKKSGKISLSATLQDLQKMRDMELVFLRKDESGIVIKKDNSIVYEKNPLLKHLPNSYFENPTRLPMSRKKKNERIIKTLRYITIPNEQDILDICKAGESQIYEFKAPGIEMDKLSKEICAFANTKMGGIIFYGVQDDGVITNADKRRQVFDQSLQNSIRNTVAPSLSIRVIEKDVLGYKILIIAIPPWNRKEVYHFRGRVYIRRGTNVFEAKPEESKKLHRGEYIT